MTDKNILNNLHRWAKLLSIDGRNTKQQVLKEIELYLKEIEE